MRMNRTISAYRAFFGGGFVVLGAVTLWRVAAVPAPPTSKVLGVVLACAMIGLGVARIAQYVRLRREPPA